MDRTTVPLERSAIFAALFTKKVSDRGEHKYDEVLNAFVKKMRNLILLLRIANEPLVATVSLAPWHNLQPAQTD